MATREPRPITFGKYATLTKRVHKTSYAAIDPSRAALSQAGKTVVITGGGSGIGYAIAQAFVAASAARVIILGRRADVIASAAQKLAAATNHPDSSEIRGIPCDISDATTVDALWAGFAKEGIAIDVLVLNAASFAPLQPLMELGTEAVWALYDANVRAQMHMTERFYKQSSRGEEVSTKNLVHVSSAAIHDFINLGSDYPAYGLTKNAGNLFLQLVAQDTPPEEMQVVTYHPGAVLSDAARATGWTEDALPWDHG